MFACKSCEYKTIKKHNLIRHIRAIHKRDVSDEEIIKIQNIPENIQNIPEHIQNIPENIQNIPKNIQNIPENIQNIPEIWHKNLIVCEKCLKNFKSFQGLKKHKIKCKGVSNNFECHFCHKILANQPSKSRHIKRCKIKKVQEQINIFETSNEEVKNIEKPNNNQTTNITKHTNNGNIYYNITNNHNNTRILTNNNNFKNMTCEEYLQIESTEGINDFGKEDTSYISEDIKRDIVANHKMVTYTTLKHFNPEHPENHNIRMNNNSTYKVAKNGKWTSEHRDVVHSRIFNQCVNDFAVFAHENLYPTYNEQDADEHRSTILKYDKTIQKSIIKTLSAKIQEIAKQYSKMLENKHNMKTLELYSEDNKMIKNVI